ncbi:hypothetical protein CQY20_10090 [Mycolicibacterium agri]|uniref:Uncharacterized protein n=1 Tax=Mycolicibacterium agri TaxID=36811 RepID=A0A2A7N614_MYCAG|nr:hypothetical protein CQY20_10090 [Mycolicibacterium agri]GFG48631.1 hypothetical protein MAGR_00720 [Mycolicibacterium agri]
MAIMQECAWAKAATQTGTRRLDTLIAQARATTQAGATAPSPSIQRAILSALRSQLAQAVEVVDSVQNSAAQVASHVRSLRYPLATLPAPEPTPAVHGLNSGALFAPLPAGPVVWCIRPRGTFGMYRCSVLYPDLGVGTYWSPTDDSGGSL